MKGRCGQPPHKDADHHLFGISEPLPECLFFNRVDLLIPPYFAACDFYITASTSDTNSISMLEGMATGLPVLQITDPLNEGQVRDGVNGFIFSSAQEMAEKIRLLRGMTDLLKQDDRKGGVALGEAVGGHQTADPTTNDGYIILFRHSAG